MPRFVVLTHDHPEWHWDFMLEHGDALWTWRLHNAPDQAGAIAAEKLTDHRLHYLDYEGPVSGNRGEVHRWDFGTYEVESDQPGKLSVRLEGGRLKGRAELISKPDSAVAHLRFYAD